DGCAATDRVLACMRRAGFSTHRNGRILPTNTARLRDGRADRGNATGLSHVHGELNGIRQAAGDLADATDYVPRAKLCQPRHLRTGGGDRHHSDLRPRTEMAVPDLHAVGAGLRRAIDYSDR